VKYTLRKVRMTTKRIHLFTNEATKDSFAGTDGIGRVAITVDGQDHAGNATRVTITFGDIYEALGLIDTLSREAEALKSDLAAKAARAYLNA
jgi:hypothetical protein